MNGQPGETSGDPRPFDAAAAATIAPDAETAELLRRHAAREKLTQPEYGKIGAFAAWFKKPFRKAGAATEPAVSPARPGQPASVAPVATSQASLDVLEPVPIDAGLARRTTAALLNRGDAFTVAWIDREARAAGATGELLNRFRSEAGLSADDKKLLIEIAPDVMTELGVDPRKFAVWTAVGVLGFHGVNLWQCVGELKEMRKAAAPAPSHTTPAATPGPTGTAAPAAPASITTRPADAVQKFVKMPDAK